MADEYIRKQDASDAVIKHLQLDYDYAWGAREAINALTSADVAPVIRCRDCAKLNRNGYCTRFQNNISGVATSWFMPDDDDFCSYGDRKGETDG